MKIMTKDRKKEIMIKIRKESFNGRNPFGEMLLITLGVMIVAFAFSFFLDPYDIVIGGVTGLAIIFEQWGINPSLTILVINMLLLVLAFFTLGKSFVIKTVYGSLLFPLCTFLFNILYRWLESVNHGELLISVDNMLLIILFSSIIMGVGLGMVIKRGATTGGTDVIQNVMYKYFKMPYSLSLLIFDGTVVILGFVLLRNTDGSLRFDFLLYAIIFMYLSGFVMDQIIFLGFTSRAVCIISEKHEEIKSRLLKDFNRGVTESMITGGYTGEHKMQLICVLSSKELYRLKNIIAEVDPKAFYYVVRAQEVGGEGFTYVK